MIVLLVSMLPQKYDLLDFLVYKNEKNYLRIIMSLTDIIIGLFMFIVILFFYLHIQFHYKTSNDLEIYEIENA